MRKLTPLLLALVLASAGFAQGLYGARGFSGGVVGPSANFGAPGIGGGYFYRGGGFSSYGFAPQSYVNFGFSYGYMPRYYGYPYYSYPYYTAYFSPFYYSPYYYGSLYGRYYAPYRTFVPTVPRVAVPPFYAPRRGLNVGWWRFGR